jgi:flagellar biogenesis protein FliO
MLAAMRSLFLMLVISCCCPVSIAAPADEQSAAVEMALEIPYKKDASGGSTVLLKAIIVMVLLLGVAGGALFLVKRSVLARKLGISDAKFIKLVELKRLSPRLSIYLLAVDNRHYLLAQSGDSLSIVEHKVLNDPANNN